MKSQRRHHSIIFLAMLIFFMMAMVGSVSALEFDLGKDTTLTVDTTLTYIAGWRAENPAKSKLGKYNPLAFNADDGNESFDQWDMINNKISAFMDINLHHKNFGIFLRPRAFYDRVYMTDNSNDSPGTNNRVIYNAAVLGKVIPTDEFDEETEDIHGKKAELLDAFAYANFNVADSSVNLRVGRQVISWGESFLLSGGISSAQAPADIVALVTPGIELKEIFLPTEAAYIQVGLTENTAFQAYYQWKWEKHRLPEAGSYFSSTDFLDESGHLLYIGAPVPFLVRGSDVQPSDSGQFGVSLSYVWPWLNETEFAIYYLNYHDKAPQVLSNFFIPMPSYYLSYVEDIKLYGASFSSQIGDTTAAGELSYRQDTPIALKTETELANVVQGVVSLTYLIGPRLIGDQMSFLGEVGFNQVLGLQNDRLAKDKFAWGYSLRVAPKWVGIIPGLDMEIPVTYAGNPNGNSSFGTFVEGSENGSVGMDLTYKNCYYLSLKYGAYFNELRNGNSDRDYISLSLKYSF